MSQAPSTPCPGCQRLQAQLEEQRVQLERQGAQLEALQTALTRVQEQLASARKSSATSSKPPSSDIVKPPPPAPPAGQGKRQRGGQPGHDKHHRAAFAPEGLTAPPHEHALDLCPDCGGALLDAPA